VGRRPSPVPKPPCPRHDGSYVVFDGRYGKPGHERQRYRCYPSGRPGNGQPFHRFVEPLPRQRTLSDVCVSCERHVHAHEGPPGPRNYEYAAREIAQALIEVGGGESYAATAARARRRAARFPTNGGGGERYTRHGQLVEDWVEVFAPVVFEQHRRSAWPSEGTLVLDHLGFRYRGWDKHGRPKTGPVGFNVFAARGYENGYGQLWSLRAYPDASPESWLDFLGRLDGAPDRVITDGWSGTIKAAQLLWPDTEHYRSEWHLQQALRDYLTKAKLHGNTSIWRALDRAFINRYWWEHFCVKAYRHRNQAPDMWAWVEQYGDLVEGQMRRRPLPSRRAMNPTTIGGLDTKLEHIKRWLKPRVRGFRNRECMNRLLMLMQLHLNDQADTDAYARAIRDWLSYNGGRPRVPRRHVADRKGSSSLLSAGAKKQLGLGGA
jgi:hypothetical protein